MSTTIPTFQLYHDVVETQTSTVGICRAKSRSNKRFELLFVSYMRDAQSSFDFANFKAAVKSLSESRWQGCTGLSREPSE